MNLFMKGSLRGNVRLLTEQRTYIRHFGQLEKMLFLLLVTMPHIRLELLFNIPVVVVVTAVVVDGDRVRAMCTTSSCFEFGSL